MLGLACMHACMLACLRLRREGRNGQLSLPACLWCVPAALPSAVEPLACPTPASVPQAKPAAAKGAAKKPAKKKAKKEEQEEEEEEEDVAGAPVLLHCLPLRCCCFRKRACRLPAAPARARSCSCSGLCYQT